ncbi:MAG TPA: extracellular solute-binding protein [Nitrospiraceae bacterium]|nr:extracellular solute-binding protein [Nitrospiraceae bacterium]
MNQSFGRGLTVVVVACLLALGLLYTPGQAAPAINLSLWSGYPELTLVFQAAAADYQKAHPNVTISILTTELRDYERKLAASIPAGTAGDILQVDYTTMDRYIQVGLIPKAPPEIAQFVRSRSFTASSQGHVTWAGDVYGVPYYAGIGVLYYNTSMFKEAGLAGPPKTMDELMAYAQKLAKKDAQGRLVRSGISLRLFGAGSGVAQKFEVLMWPRGGSLLVSSGGGKFKAGYDNDAGRATLAMHLDALYKYEVDSLDIKHDAEAFELGQTAMFARESWVVGDIAKKVPKLQYMTAPLPRDKRWGTLFSSGNLYLSQTAKDPSVAWDFIKFLVESQYARQMLEQVGWIPLRQDVNYDPVLIKLPQYKAFLFRHKDFTYWSEPFVKNFDEIQTKLAERLVAAFRDRSLAGNPSAIAQAIHTWAEETNSILRRDGLYAP